MSSHIKSRCLGGCNAPAPTYRDAKALGWRRFYGSPRWGTGFVCPTCWQAGGNSDRRTVLKAAIEFHLASIRRHRTELEALDE